MNFTCYYYRIRLHNLLHYGTLSTVFNRKHLCECNHLLKLIFVKQATFIELSNFLWGKSKLLHMLISIFVNSEAFFQSLLYSHVKIISSLLKIIFSSEINIWYRTSLHSLVQVILAPNTN